MKQIRKLLALVLACLTLVLALPSTALAANRGEPAGYVLDSLRETTTKIINIRAYLLTALYNAPLTIGPYYSAAVRHDRACP